MTQLPEATTLYRAHGRKAGQLGGGNRDLHPTRRSIMAGTAMSNEVTLRTIRTFFTTVGYAGLVLPNGWFGRPYDNLLQLTRSQASPEKLLIELDGQLVLTFIGEPRATSIKDGLVLNKFLTLMWTWTKPGSIRPHHEEFTTGEVKFVATTS